MTLTAISADSHVNEPPDLFVKRLPGRLRTTLAPRLATAVAEQIGRFGRDVLPALRELTSLEVG